MKNIVMVLLVGVLMFGFSGCTETQSQDQNGNKKTEFSISETATVNKTNIKINSVKKVMSECLGEYQGQCIGETKPNNSYFLVVDLTIENKNDKDLAISSIASFELKDTTGEKGGYAMLTNSIQSQLDGTVMPNDLLKGQIAYDVKNSEVFYFYYKDSLIDSPIKFIINKSDIME